MASAPRRVASISVSPLSSTSRTMPLTMRSMRSSSMPRLRVAIMIERLNLSRSNGTRLPSRLITVSSRSWMRSKVVKRAPQALHWRRRRTAPPSSTGRESLTWLSSEPQNGQRIGPLHAIAINAVKDVFHHTGRSSPSTETSPLEASEKRYLQIGSSPEITTRVGFFSAHAAPSSTCARSE